MDVMILVVDDDPVVRSSLSLMLKRAGYDVDTVASPDEAITYVRRCTPHLILMDMNFGLSTTGEEGLELLQRVRIFCPRVPVILITAWGSIHLAVRGMQAGAFDFITKPWNNHHLLQSITTALELSRPDMSSEEITSRTDLDRRYDFSGIVGQSTALVDVLSTVGRVASTNASVLITGESGTGKELIAEAIHRNSRRRKQPFVKVNLGGISQSLFESEMFGHKKGAFTDAMSDREGRFALADKGTIFLDEIGELDAAMQVKLLRVLQDQTFEVLGDSMSRRVDVRVVSATNADLPSMVRERTFREDLLYRINLITIHIPPLRERPTDIRLLAEHFAERVAQSTGQPVASFSSEGMQLLERMPFVGNIRELKNLIERTVIMSGKRVITDKDLRMNVQEFKPMSLETSTHIQTARTLDEVEKDTIREAIERYEGNLSRVARELGLSRAALYRRMEKYGI